MRYLLELAIEVQNAEPVHSRRTALILALPEDAQVPVRRWLDADARRKKRRSDTQPPPGPRSRRK